MTQALLATHPLLACLDEAEAMIRQAESLEPAFLATSEKASALRRLQAMITEAEALRLRVLAVAGDVAEVTGARDLASWLRVETRADAAQARADVRLAASVEHRHRRVAEALGSGSVSVAQARVICRALDELPEGVTAAEHREAERILVEAAADLSPKDLRLLGRRVLELVDPVRFEHAEAARLEALERAAEQRVALTVTDRGDGTSAVRGVLPTSDAVRLRTFLEAYAQPRRQSFEEQGVRVPYERLLGQAFQQLPARVVSDDLPRHGGDATTVVVTMTIDQLRAELGTAGLGFDGERITASEARRLACNAHLVPAVLGTGSEVLDLGRAARLHTPAQRKAIRLRDRTCRAEGCDVPAPWCEVHHLTAWADGGATTVDSSALLWGRHHRRAHRPDQRVLVGPAGRVAFHRRT